MARTRAVRLAFLALGTSACASAPEPVAKPVEEVVVIEAWFAVRGASCDAVIPKLGVAATLREGQASPWRHAEVGGFCAVAPAAGQRAVRIDSLAMQVSEGVAAPAVSFYAARGSWSYTVFDRGEPILTLESHLGRPSLDGDVVRASGLIGGDVELLEQSLEQCRDMSRFSSFLGRLGLDGFRESMHELGAGADGLELEASDPSATLAKIPAGAWAALPPLGVVLVRAVEIREKNGVSEPTYVIVNGMSTLELPVIRAEKMGMRPIATEKEAKDVQDLIEDGVVSPGRDYDANRVKGWLDLVSKGDLEGIATVYATLCALQGSRKLYQVEAALLAGTLDWLSQELATAQQKPTDAVEEQLKDACR